MNHRYKRLVVQVFPNFGEGFMAEVEVNDYFGKFFDFIPPHNKFIRFSLNGPKTFEDYSSEDLLDNVFQVMLETKTKHALPASLQVVKIY